MPSNVNAPEENNQSHAVLSDVTASRVLLIRLGSIAVTNAKRSNANAAGGRGFERFVGKQEL